VSRNLLLIFEYDGTAFHGWQRQGVQRTVQGTAEEAISQLEGRPCSLRTSSRTDAGVHALAHPAGLRTERNLPLMAYFAGLNSMLPPDLSVRQVLEVGPDFDARRSARGKRYAYRIYNAPGRRPLYSATSWHIPWALDLRAMREAAIHFLGEHDMSAFRAAHCDSKSTVRNIRAVDIHSDGDLVTIEIEANAFLRNMARVMVGTLVEVGRGRRPPDWLPGVLAAKDRTLAGMTAPAHGLCLKLVYYPPNAFLDSEPRGSVYELSQPRA
jgi:tRNA pseudouridine38-40 synthase